MTIFALCALSDSNAQALATALAREFPTDHLQVSGVLWFLAAEGLTAKDVCDKLGITDGKVSTGIVISIAGYFGRAPQNIWEWIATKSK